MTRAQAGGVRDADTPHADRDARSTEIDGAPSISGALRRRAPAGDRRRSDAELPIDGGHAATDRPERALEVARRLTDGLEVLQRLANPRTRLRPFPADVSALR